MSNALSPSIGTILSPSSERWGASQRIRLDLERDAFAKLLDARDTPRSSMSAGTEEMPTEATRVEGLVKAAQGGADSASAEVTPRVVRAFGAEGLSPSELGPHGVGQEHGDGIAAPLAASRPMPGRTDAEIFTRAERSSSGRSATEAQREVRPFWVTVDGDEAHLAIRVKGDTEQVHHRLNLLLDELGLQQATLKINGIAHQADAGQQEKKHGG